jgi:hypothetical protein
MCLDHVDGFKDTIALGSDWYLIGATTINPTRKVIIRSWKVKLDLLIDPHGSNLMQQLDLSTFDITKRIICRVNQMESVNVQSAHIAQVVGSFLSPSSPPNIVGTFRIA